MEEKKARNAAKDLFCGVLLVLFGISILLARWAVKPVEQAFAREKQFVADASHELRTPLSAVIGYTLVRRMTNRLRDNARLQAAGK